QHQVSTAALSNHFALRGTNMNRPSAGAHCEVSTNVANVNTTAAGFRADRSTDVVQMDSASTTLRLQPARDSGGHNCATFGFDLDQVYIAWHAHRHIRRKLVRAPAFPFTHNPGGVASHVG